MNEKNAQVVEVEGKKYCVKSDWTPVEGAKTFVAYAVEEDAELEGSMYPAVKLEAFPLEDGKWDVIGVTGPELVDENGGCYGTLTWSEKAGLGGVCACDRHCVQKGGDDPSSSPTSNPTSTLLTIIM